MKALALLLVLAFGALQGIAITDCPCGSLCETKNACPDDQRHQSADDCCSRPRPQSQRATDNCFHLEPQSDLVDLGAGVAVDLPVLVEFVVDPPAAFLSSHADVEVEWAGLSPPRRSRPLFLLHSALLL